MLIIFMFVYSFGFFLGLVNLLVDHDVIIGRDMFFERLACVIFWPLFIGHDVYFGLLRAWRDR